MRCMVPYLMLCRVRAVQTLELTKNAIELVLEESKLECKKAIKFIKALRQAYPEVTRAVKTKIVALTVLNKKGKFMEHLKDGLIVEEKDYETIQRAIIQRTNMLAMRGYKGDKLPEPKELMKRTELFRDMDEEEYFEKVVKRSKHRLFQAGQSLFHKGDNPLSFFLVIRGSTKRCGRLYTLQQCLLLKVHQFFLPLPAH